MTPGKITFDGATPVFLVSDIASTMQWYVTHLGFNVQGVPVRDLFDELSKVPEVTLLESLCHQPYGQTEFVVRDPNGYALVFAQRD